MTINALWHAKHRMPDHPTLDQRMAWHIAHARECACRPMPPKVEAQIRGLRGRRGRSRAASPHPERA
jgi:hypothetical protein